MQDEPRREESSRLRRIPVRGSGETPADGPTAENQTAEGPAEGRLGAGSAAGSWETGSTGYAAGHAAGRAEDRTGGGQETVGAPGYGGDYRTGSSSMGAQDEQTWSVLSHLSVLAGLIGLMPFGALIIWLVYKDRSPRVGFHALQSLWYQIAWIVILVVGWFITFILSFILIGLLLIPVMAIASLVPFVHGCYAAYKVSQGVDYRYPYIADRIGGSRRSF